MNLWILARLLAYAALLVAIVSSVRVAATLSPVSAARRRAIVQALPLFELLLAFLFALAVVRELFEGWPEAVGLLGVLFGGAWLARFALMDLVSGVVLRIGGRVARGDRVRVGQLEGVVTQLGGRTLAVETRSGDEALVPWSVLARESVLRAQTKQGAHRHTFRVRGEAAAEPERIRRLALLSHWSSVARPPVVEPVGDGTCEVTVFAIAPDQGPEIETFVRQGLAAPAVAPGPVDAPARELGPFVGS